MSEFKDFVQLPAQGQATPVNYVQGGVLTTVSSPGYIGTPLTSASGNFNFQLSTQDNNAYPQYLSGYAWLTTVASSYSSPGKIGGP